MSVNSTIDLTSAKDLSVYRFWVLYAFEGSERRGRIDSMMSEKISYLCQLCAPSLCVDRRTLSSFAL